ncbi:MAG: ABC transporter substrate-binding protein, partial [Pseudomonadota bacterium]
MTRPRWSVACLIVALAALGACSGQGDDERRTSVRIGVALEPPHLDPTAGAAAAIDEVVFLNVFEGLTRIGEDGSVGPGLAESWSVSEDGLAYRFVLREGVVFHDGSAFDAEDVTFTLDRARAEGTLNANRAFFSAIEAVDAIDLFTVELRLSRPDGNLLFNLGQGDAAMVAPESAEENVRTPIGTGPFKFARWRRGDALTLHRFEDYWGRAPALERATFRIIAEPSAGFAALLAGDVDAFPNFPAPENIQLIERNPRFSVVVGTTEGETILAVNNAQAPFDRRSVRQALAHAVDKSALIDGAMFGFGTPIGSHFPPHHPAYVDLAGRYPFAPDEARRLLQGALGGETVRARLMLPPPGYARRSGEIIAAQLRDVGVETEIVPLEWARWLDQVFANKDYDLTIVAHTEPLDIDIYARDDYYFGYSDPAFRELMARLSAETDAPLRKQMYAEAQRALADAAVNVFLFQIPKIGVWDTRLRGLWADAPIQANDLTGVHWVEEE